MGNGTPTPPSAKSRSGPETEPDLTGQTLGDFQVIGCLGQGGMGFVYLADQLSLKRKVALKILRPDLSANPTSLKRFKIEAEAIAKFTHPNIVQVFAFGEVNGYHFIALEYVQGTTLGRYMAKKGPLPVPLVVKIMRQVGSALQEASERGIIHRDIKPANILLTRKGEVKVTDFGLARCIDGDGQNPTQVGVILGTPLYMSPEQLDGRAVDPRADIYSFGATCYHMLAGQPPYEGETSLAVAFQHVQGQMVPLTKRRPGLSAELAAIVHKMMAKERAGRYPSCREMLKDLATLRDLSASPGTERPERGPVTDVEDFPDSKDETIEQARTPSLGGRVPRKRPLESKRGPFALLEEHPWLALLAGGIFMVLLGGVIGMGLRPKPAKREAPPAPPLGGNEVVPAPVAAASEEALKAAAQAAVNRADPADIRRGLNARIKLMQFYLEQSRLQEADRFAEEQVRNTHLIKIYSGLGQIGHAIVLALQNRAKESNQLFLEVTTEANPRFAESVGALMRRPELYPFVSQALEQNARNATADNPFPPQLESFRKAS